MRKKSTFARKKRETRSRAWISVLCTVVLVFASIPCTFASANESSVTGTAESSADAVQIEQPDASNETIESTSEETSTSTDSITIASGSSDSGETEGSASASSVQEQEEEDAATSATASPTAKAAARSSTSDVGTLSVKLSNDSGAYEDVSSFANGSVDWALDSLRTMSVRCTFGTGSNKSIQITVPTGYQIVGYSATDSTAELDGVQKISIDQQYKDYFQSSVLTAIDGSSAWDEQIVSGYLYEGNNWSVDRRIYSGIVTYTFSDSTTEGYLVLTLKPQEEILEHCSVTEELNDITVQMSSSAGEASESFHANVTHIEAPYFDHSVTTSDGGQDTYVLLDSETGLSRQFGIVGSIACYNSERSLWESFLADEWTLEISYPAGVYFDSKVLCNYLGMPDYVTDTGEIISDHFYIDVTGNKLTGGTVKLTFLKTTCLHWSWEDCLGAFFVADTNTGKVSAGDTLTFTAEFNMSNKGATTSNTFTYTRTLVEDGGTYEVEAWGRDIPRRDIHAEYPEYDDVIALGGWYLCPTYSYTDVPFLFDFSDFNGVRCMFIPGYNIRDVIVETTMGRTISLDSIPEPSNGAGAPLSEEALGLQEGEYLTSVRCLADLDQIEYGEYAVVESAYLGEFVDGQGGTAVFSILNDDGTVAESSDGTPLRFEDTVTIAWDTAAAGWTGVQVWDDDYNEVFTYHPNDTMHFYSYVMPGYDWANSDTITDPIVVISLPKGVNLDTSSVRSHSDGVHSDGETVSLVQVGTPTEQTIDGIEWVTYRFTSANPLDMVAAEKTPDHDERGIELYFEAIVASNSPEYGQISLADCVAWDLGQTSTYSPFEGEDTHNRAGKGTEYKLVKVGDNITVKPLIGLNVDLGIRVKGSDTDFYTYDTTDNSIAALTKNSNAEVRISYENTAETDYFRNSVIYLPIPKIGNDFAKYFQNIELKDPVNNTDNKTFEFNTNLATQVTLDGFATYYSVDATENSATYDPSTNAGTWAPVTGTWYTYDELIAAGKSLADVTMLKLVAEDNIATGEKAEATFELAIDSDARIGQLDYWRAYSKAITDNGTGAGVWNHSSVLAATPSSEGLLGQVFIDSDYDGFFNTDAGDSAYTEGQVTAILSRDDGTMGNLELVINDDGSFRSLNENGSVYYLKPGDYTISFEETDDTYRFSGASGSQASTDSAWYNDLKPENVEETEATYHFTIDESNEMGCYVGIGMTDRLDVISIDVPIKVKIALKADGTWCTPTATDNYILNNSTCAMRVASAETNPTTGFNFAAADSLGDSSASNVFGGTVQSGSGDAQDLTAIDTSSSAWKMTDGSATDGSNRLPLQLTGSIKNVDGHYFTDLIHLFDITYTFEKATAGGE